MDIGSSILTWIVSIVSLLIGFYLGKGGSVSLPKLPMIKMPKLPNNSPVGTFKNPTAKDLYYMKNPEGIKIKQGEDAFKELLDKEFDAGS